MEVIKISELPQKHISIKQETPIHLDPFKVGELFSTTLWNAWRSKDLSWDLGLSRKAETFKVKFLKGGLYPEGGLYIEVGDKEVYFESYRKVEKWLADNLSANMPAYVKYKDSVRALIIKLMDITAIVTQNAFYALYGEVWHQGSYMIDGKPISLLKHTSGSLAISFEEMPMFYRIDF